MDRSKNQEIKEICQKYGMDRTQAMNIVLAVQQTKGQVDDTAIDQIAEYVGAKRVEIEGVVSFYAFLSKEPKGKYVIRVCNDIIDKMQGADQVADALRSELGIEFGETTPDGKFTLEWTPCIGMCDQAPAALVNDIVMTKLTGDRARQIVRELLLHGNPKRLIKSLGDGNNAHELVQSMVQNNRRMKGEVLFGQMTEGDGLRKALSMSPVEVIRQVKTARLRGRGGAGFPTGMKWEFTRASEGDKRFVICNADEGEPGTFKDRVILTQRPDFMFEGMTIAGYAIGSDTGILYLRAEYAYLRPFLEYVLQQRREKGLLGHDICGSKGFNFDIHIQMGAGAYICGEESALISSCEGYRGDPKNRPPFPAQKGYLDYPTSVNNVETLCCVTRILEKGAAWFSQFGTKDSPGTKLISISGDCRSPGVYEVEFGITLREMLKLAGAEDVFAVQVGGPSGQLVGESDFDKPISFEGLATGGSMMVFGAERDVIDIARAFMEFFIEESCGYCTPCRVGNVLLKERLDRIANGQGEPADLDYLKNLANTIKVASRCGLGQTSPNPVLTTLNHFRPEYEKRVKKPENGFQPAFDINKATSAARVIAGRTSDLHI